ncbi:MAG: hypothetical protein ACI3V5_11150 [Faecousia sp.]
MKKPVAVFVSQTKKNTSVVALLPLTVNAKQIVSPIAIDGFGVNNRIVFNSNSITSGYGKTTAIKQLNQAVQDEANGKFSLLYIMKNEAITLLQRAGLQLPGGLIPHDGFIHSIRENASPVKAKFKNATETKQFKRWLRDFSFPKSQNRQRRKAVSSY